MAQIDREERIDIIQEGEEGVDIPEILPLLPVRDIVVFNYTVLPLFVGRDRSVRAVDAAMAGSAMILPEYRRMWDGIEGADSIVLNPHKWLGVVFDCSLFYTRNSEHLIRVMSTNPSYLRT